jgi:TolB protein
VKAAGVAILALGLAFASFAGAATTSGRIVFSATDAPLTGDVVVVHADGTQIDLSKSSAYDTAPAVSPDGKLVAFYSTRGGRGAEYVVKIDGTGLRRISPTLAVEPTAVAWSWNDRDLAILSGAGQGHPAIYRALATGGVWQRLDHGNAQLLASWSQAAPVLAYVTTLDDVVVVSGTGTKLFTLNGENARWSPTGRIAVQRDSRTWQVYDGKGRRLSTLAATTVAWSSQGSLASVTPGGVLQVRPGGIGTPKVAARPVRRPGAVVWAGRTHVLVQGEDGYLGYDVVHKATFELASAYRTLPSLSADGVAFGAVHGLSLARSTLSGSTRTLVTVSSCGGKDTEPYGYLQALPDGTGGVYAGDCVLPHDLFSVAPDGTGLTRLTTTPQDELEPALSPDGTRLAFARAASGGCIGCDVQIWITALDGSDAHSVTLPADATSIRQDDRPSFSPDGSKIVFARWNASKSDSSMLAEAPATGGSATTFEIPAGNPAWGPSRIAFDSAKGDVETVKPDGSGATAVPNTKLGDGGVPAWSTDGRLAILRPAGSFSIYFPATAKGIALPGLHESIGQAPGLAWSPDGTKLAFTAADANGEDDVWSVGVDGSGLTRVTNGLVADGALAWR